MASVNKVILIGRLGKNPDQASTTNGTSVCKFSLATSEKYNGKETVTWHNIVAYGKLADVCSQYLSKGREVYIEGKISNREFEDKQFKGCMKTWSEVIIEKVEFIGSKGDSASQNVNTNYTTNDIPF